MPDASSNGFLHKSVTISSADTWEYFSVTIPGNTSQSIPADNGNGLQIGLCFAAGPTFQGGTRVEGSWHSAASDARGLSSNIDIFSSASNYVQVTGMQLEVGDQATPFEHLPLSQVERACYRYYYNHRFGFNDGGAYSSKRRTVWLTRHCIAEFPVTMRATPTISIQSSSANSMDRYGRGQELCYPKPDNIHPNHFQNIIKYTSAAQTTTSNWVDSGNYLNRAGYKADAEL